MLGLAWGSQRAPLGEELPRDGEGWLRGLKLAAVALVANRAGAAEQTTRPEPQPRAEDGIPFGNAFPTEPASVQDPRLVIDAAETAP